MVRRTSKNISRVDNTMAKVLNTEVMPKLGTMSYGEIMNTMIDILDNPDISMKDTTRAKYRAQIELQPNLNALMEYIYNLGLASSGLGVI